MKQLKSWFFSTVRGLNSRNKFINLADFGEPDQITFTDLLDTTLTKKIDSSNFQDQADFNDINAVLDGDKFVNPASLPEVQLGFGSILTLNTVPADSGTPRRIFVIDAPQSGDSEIAARTSDTFTTPANMPVVEADPTPGNTITVTPFTLGGYTTYQIFATGGGSGGTNYANKIIVDPNGNDGTAVVGDITKPFLTINAAINAASAGDLVWVNPGSYTPTAIMNKNDVVLYLEKGVTITTNFSSFTFGIFGDNGTPSNFAVLGYGDIIQNATDSKIAAIAGVGSTLILECNSLVDNRDQGIGAQRCSFVFVNGTGIIRVKTTFHCPLTGGFLIAGPANVKVYGGTWTVDLDAIAEVRGGPGPRLRFYGAELKHTSNSSHAFQIGFTSAGTGNILELHDCILTATGTGQAIATSNGVQDIVFKGENIITVNSATYTFSGNAVQSWRNYGKIFRNKGSDPSNTITLLYGDDVIDAGITYNIP